MGTPKRKTHTLEPARFERLSKGEPQVCPCGAIVTDVDQVRSDLSLLPQRLRCARCSHFNPSGPTARLRSIEELALSSEDGTVSAQAILSLIRGR
jgi:hypothetical protein